jgi:hypothetical protein
MSKRHPIVACILALVCLEGLALLAEASVTEKVDAMIAENTPLKVRDTDAWVMVGAPLALGVQYDVFANANVAVGAGVGSLGNGTSGDIAAKFFLLPGRFSPFLAGGAAFYFGELRQNVVALFGTVGLSYYFDRGLGFSLGLTYVGSVGKSDDILNYNYINHTNEAVTWVSPQAGIHWNF